MDTRAARGTRGLTSKPSQRDWKPAIRESRRASIFDAGATTPVPWTLDQKAALAFLIACGTSQVSGVGVLTDRSPARRRDIGRRGYDQRNCLGVVALTEVTD